MEHRNYEKFITRTVESMLPSFSDQKLGLGMIIEMVWNYYSKDRENNKRFRKNIFILFHRSSNYTKVLMKDITNEKFPYSKKIKIKLLADHDSEWKSDGMMWMFKTFCDAWDYFDKFGIEGRKISPIVGYWMFNGLPAYYEIELENKNKYNDPWYLTIKRKIPINEISNYMCKE